MKNLFYAVYQINNHTNFTLALRQLGFQTREEAIAHINTYVGGRFIIQEYYE